ncbi:unnamed protein product [Lota lota]
MMGLTQPAPNELLPSHQSSPFQRWAGTRQEGRTHQAPILQSRSGQPAPSSSQYPASQPHPPVNIQPEQQLTTGRHSPVPESSGTWSHPGTAQQLDVVSDTCDTEVKVM